MPGYGILPADQGGGLLPWSWAEQRLRASQNYWIATVWPDGRPHLMPVWAVWDGEFVWFSSSLASRKIRNLQVNPDITLSTEDAQNPVVLEGSAQTVTETVGIQYYLGLMNAKYDTDYQLDFLDATQNATVRVRPRWAFGLKESEFAGSPTRWEFP